MEFEQISYVKFDGDTLGGTIGENTVTPYFFNRILGSSPVKVFAAHSEIIAAAKALATRRLTRDVKQEPFILTLGGTNRKVGDSVLDQLERDLNTLVSAWHEKK